MTALNRTLAPLSPAAWEAIDSEAGQVLKVMLAGRKLVDFQGPLGWTTSAVDTGRVEDAGNAPEDGVTAQLRKVQPLVELRREFEVSLNEADAIDRGAKDADLEPVVNAAQSMATAEDKTLFDGMAAAGIDGIRPSSAYEPLQISEKYENYPKVVAGALSALRQAGVDGPYAIALGPRCFKGLSETTVNGFPVMNHVASLLDIPPVSAPVIDGAVVLSMRGGDFELSVGRDYAIGYLEHDSRKVKLFIDQSFTFRVLGPEAAVPLTYSKQRRRKA